jgi:hypothetical protein
MKPITLPHDQHTIEKYFYGDIPAGLSVSKSRCYGSVLIENREESAKLWVAEPDKVAAHYGVSKRIVAMAGNAMLGQRVMLPTDHFGDDDYVVAGSWPLNSTEKEVWKERFLATHFTGAHISAAGLHGGPVVFDGKPIPRTWVPVIANSPQYIFPAVLSMFTTPTFKVEAFRTALNLAHRIDAGDYQPVAGYEKRNPGDWKDEPTAPASIPEFTVAREF